MSPTASLIFFFSVFAGYGIVWFVVASLWLEYIRAPYHRRDGTNMFIALVAGLWPFFWPAILAFVIHRHRYRDSLIEQRLQHRIGQNLKAKRKRERDNRISELERELGLVESTDSNCLSLVVSPNDYREYIKEQNIQAMKRELGL